MGESHGGLYDENGEKGRNTARESLSEQSVSPFVASFSPRSCLRDSGELLRIGRLLYQPAAPTGKDGACGDILCCSGIKPSFLVSASALENWEGESNGSLFVRKHELLKAKFYFPDITHFLLFHDLSPTSWRALGVGAREVGHQSPGQRACVKVSLDHSSKDPTNVSDKRSHTQIRRGYK